MANTKKDLFCLVTPVFIFLFLTVPVVHGDGIPEFTMATEDWPPYNFKEDGVVKGISTDTLVLMLERTGSSQGRSDVRLYPWARAYHMGLNQPGTILFTTTRTAKRENLFKWVGPIFEIYFYLYALKSRQLKINSLDDIKTLRIGTHLADAAEEVLISKTNMSVTDFERVSSNLSNMKKLLLGRIDLIFQSRETTINTAKEAGLNPDDFDPVFLVDQKGMYFAFHKDIPDSVTALMQKAFDDIKKPGGTI